MFSPRRLRSLWPPSLAGDRISNVSLLAACLPVVRHWAQGSGGGVLNGTFNINDSSGSGLQLM